MWHFLGAVQRNKVARLAPVVAWWQGVSRVEEGRAIAGRRPGATVLVQVDVAGLPGRGGCPPDEVPDLVGALRDLDLDVAGLMAVGPPGPPEESRPGFALVSRLADRLDLPVRSMGMSDDLEVALSEGSTMVRLGRALFGARPRPRRPVTIVRGRGPLTTGAGLRDPASGRRRWWSTSPRSQALRCAQEETMPASFMKKTMAYLGLVDDDYDDFDDYEPRSSSTPARGRTDGPAVGRGDRRRR